jgi:hypothetical protein
MSPEEYSQVRKRGFFKPSTAPRVRYEPKLTLSKRIIGNWELERKFTGHDPEKKRDEFLVW